MERILVRQNPLFSLSIAVIGAMIGVVFAGLNFTDSYVVLGARVLFGLVGFMSAYAFATWYLNR